MRKKASALAIRWPLLGAAFFLAFWATGVGAHADWAITASGNGSSNAAVVPAGKTPTATLTNGTSVVLTWQASTYPNGTPVAGYIVTRYDVSVTPNVAYAPNVGCSGQVNSTTCTEDNVPQGVWRYTVTPTQGGNWIGAESPKSNAVCTPPVITLSRTSGSVGSSVTINGRCFSASSALTVTFDGAQVTTSPLSPQSSASGGISGVSFSIPAHVAGSFRVTITDTNLNSATQFLTVLPALALSPTTGAVGTNVTLTGTGFGNTKPVTVYFNGTAVSTNPSPLTSSSSGSFNAVFQAPAAPGQAYIVQATDSLNNTASATFTIVATIHLDQSSGPVGTTIHVTGGGFLSNHSVTVTFDATTTSTTVTSDANGSFSAFLVVPSGPAGTYQVNATDGTNSAQASFTIVPSLALLRTSGPAGTGVSVSGQGFAANSTISIAFDGSLVGTTPALVTTDANGGFSGVTFNVPTTAATGVYPVQGTDASGNTGTATFTVTP